MNKLPIQTRVQILTLLCEGSSVRSTSRITGVSPVTVLKLLADAGKACAEYHDENVREVKSRRIEADEIWSFVGAKQKTAMNLNNPEYGDVWTWTAFDTDSKLIVSYMVGGRDSDSAILFMDDLRERLANKVQLTTDGHKAYLEAVEGAFGGNIDYAQLIKLFGPGPDTTKGRYSPAECRGAIKTPISGKPNKDFISTSGAERMNLSIRMGLRRFTRLTNSFSKKLENHCHALALYFMFYNYVRVHISLKTSPAMAAGLTKRLWEWSDIVGLIDGIQPKV